MGTGLSAAAAAALGTVLLITLGGGAFAVSLRRRQSERRRATALRHLAADLGWAFVARDDAWIHRLPGPPFQNGGVYAPRSGGGRRRRARHVLIGEWHGRPAVAFDYSVRIVASAGFGQVATRTVRYAVFVLELPALAPRLDVVAAPMAARLTRFAGLPGIEFESEDFNRAFRISCADARFATDVLTPQTMQLLLERGDGVFRLAGRYALWCLPHPLDAAEATGRFATLERLVSGVAPFVWADLVRSAPARELG